MADFFQNGLITTFHNLTNRTADDLDRELVEWSANQPISLVIPSLFSELEGDALPHIVDELARVPFLDEIIIGLDGADADQFAQAKQFFAKLPQRHRILWNDGPRLRTIDEQLQAHDIAPTQAGKGRNVWYCLGYYLASGRGEVVALHDADVKTYSRDMLSRLVYPLVHPTMGYAFSKGYYFREGDGNMNGRVTRLMVTPLVRSLRSVIGQRDDLDYLDSFRYPLAGEFAMHVNVVRNLRIPSDWGLEIGVLTEVRRRYTNRRICQVDIADAYDHKHQEVSADDSSAGLHKMGIDIAKATFRKLAITGVTFSPEVFRTLKAAYYRSALDLVDQHHNDAIMNGMSLDRHTEEGLVEMFAGAIMEAGDEFLSNPMESPFVPSWSRVRSALPEVFDELVAAVEADNSD